MKEILITSGLSLLYICMTLNSQQHCIYGSFSKFNLTA